MTVRNLGIALRKAGRLDEAAATATHARRLFVKLHGEDNMEVQRADGDLAVVRLDQGLLKEAERLGLSSYKWFRDNLGEKDPRTKTGATIMGMVYDRMDRPEEAARYKALAETP